MAEPARSPRYLPALDGLRAVAVGMVMAYHLGYRWAAGGYLGVDLFFVLSGYLITGLLLEEWQRTGGIALRAFWARRARRLLPGLLLMLAALCLYAAWRPSAFDGSRLRIDALATVAYVANWRQILGHQTYFQQFAAASPLRHTWSLAIEEQFYLLWPLLLIAFLSPLAGRGRRGGRGRRRALLLTAVLALGSAVLLAVRFHPGLDPTRAYEGTDTRAFEPLVGAALALLVSGWQRRSPRQEAGMRAAGLAAFGVLGAWSVTAGGPPKWMYRGGMFIAALLAAVVIVSVAGSRPGPLGRLLSLPPLRYVGRISYGLYLWHWPVYLVTGDTGLSGTALDLCRVGLTVALAAASYHLVEQPVRRAPRVVRPAWLVVGGATAAAVLATTAALPGMASASGSLPAPTAAVGPVAAPPSAATAPSLVAVAAPAPARPASVVVVGDSTAMTLAAGLAARQESLGLVVHNSGALGCSVVGNYTADDVYGPRRLDAPLPACDWAIGWAPMLERYRPQVVVMLFGPWDTADHLVDGHWLLVGTASWLDYYESRLNQMVSLLSSRGAVVVLATAPHYHHQPSPGEPAPRFSDPARVDALNRAYRAFAASHPGVVLEDLSSIVTLSDLVDGVHFSPAGGQRVAAILGPELARLATARYVR